MRRGGVRDVRLSEQLPASRVSAVDRAQGAAEEHARLSADRSWQDVHRRRRHVQLLPLVSRLEGRLHGANEAARRAAARRVLPLDGRAAERDRRTRRQRQHDGASSSLARETHVLRHTSGYAFCFF